MPDLIPAPAKKKMEAACKKVAKKVGKSLEPVTDGKKLEKKIAERCKKEIKTIDKKVVQFLVDKLKEELDKKNKKKDEGVPKIPKATAKWTPKSPGSGVPSLTIPITQYVLDKQLDTKAKFSIKVWADLRDFKKSDKGVMVNFTVVNW